MCCSADIFLGIIALIFPPFPVWVKRGLCSADSLINILLCLLGIIPGLLHSWYIIAKFPEPPYEYEQVPQDGERGRVTYVYVQNHPAAQGGQQQGVAAGRGQQQQQQQQPKGQQAMNYGTQGQQANGSHAGGSSGGNEQVPPSYASVVAGDNKVQNHD